MKLKDWEHHIKSPEVPYKAWCGADIALRWAFVDVAHATAHLQYGRISPCPACLAALEAEAKRARGTAYS